MTKALAHIPRSNPRIDVKTLPLRPEEAFVLSRVDGQSSAKDIEFSTGLTAEQVDAALDRLFELTAISGWREVPVATNPDDEGFVAVPDLDISPAEQLRIWRLWKKVDRCNHYELLGVPRSAPRDQIKAAYFEQVAAFHPDKHFGKKLGTYKERFETIFQRLTLAHDTLSRSKRREDYDATLPASTEVASLFPKPKAEQVVRGAEVMPLQTSEVKLPGGSGAIPSVSTGSGRRGSGCHPAVTTEHRSSGTDVATSLPVQGGSGPLKTPSAPPVSEGQRRQMAIRALERGLRTVPSGERPAVRSSTPIRRSPSAPPPSSRSQGLDSARQAEASGEWMTAAVRYERLATQGQDPLLFAKAAECFERIARPEPHDPLLKRAGESARQAVQLAPNNVQLRMQLSGIYARAGMLASAIREAEKGQELSPTDKTVQSWLERLRRGDV